MNRLSTILAAALFSAPLTLPTVASASILPTVTGDAVIHQDAAGLQEVRHGRHHHHWSHGRYRWHHRYYSYRRWHHNHWIYR